MALSISCMFLVFFHLLHTGFVNNVSFKSSQKISDVGEESLFDVSAVAREGVLCVINFGDRDCQKVLTGRDINVEETYTTLGKTISYVYKSPGKYVLGLNCDQRGETVYLNDSVIISEALSGLKIIPDQKDKTVELRQSGDQVQGTVNFTFDTGTYLSGVFLTDEGIERSVIIEEGRKSGFASFSPNDFLSYGAHVINITMFNVYNNSYNYYVDIKYKHEASVLQTVQYEEVITHVSLAAPSFSLVNKSVNFTANVTSGSNINLTWTCHSIGPCWDTALGYSHSYAFSQPGEYSISLQVTNIYGTKTTDHVIRILLPVRGFTVSVSPPNSTTRPSLYLHTPEDDILAMGDLYIEITNDNSMPLRPATKLYVDDTDIVILQHIPPGNTTLHISVYSSLSRQELQIDVNTEDIKPLLPFSVQTKSTIVLPDGFAHFVIRTDHRVNTTANGICTIDFRDSSSETVLSYRDMIIRGEVNHTFLNSGMFNVTFMCENAISVVSKFSLVKVIRFTAADFKFSYTRAIQRNSSEENSEVIINADLFGLLDVPNGVEIEWDFGDGRLPQKHPLTSWTFAHMFYQRGQFNMTVKVMTEWGDNHSTVLPIQIGILQFSASPRFGYAFLDTVIFYISGIYGKLVSYTLNYADGTSDRFTRLGIGKNSIVSITKDYAVPGLFRPHILASSENITEEVFLPYAIQISHPNVVLFIEPKVYFPPGITDVIIFLDQHFPVVGGTRMWCVVDFHDGSPTQTFVFEPQLDEPQFVYTHTFVAVGKLNVNGNCTINNKTFIGLQRTTDVISNCYGSESPLSYLRGRIKTRVSERLTLAAKPEILCLNMTAGFIWRVEQNGTSVDIKQPRSSLLVLLPRSMNAGDYLIEFYTNFVEIPTIFTSDSVIVTVADTPLQANIKGGNYKNVGEPQLLVIDAITHSFDPDLDFHVHPGLQFVWTCTTHASRSEAFRSMSSTPAHRNSCLDADFPSQGLLVLKPGCLRANNWYKFHVMVRKGNRSSAAFQIVHVVGDPVQVEIRCRVNCNFGKVDAEFSLGLYTECLNCTCAESLTAKFSWSLYEVDPVSLLRKRQISLDNITSTGSNISALSILPNSLTPGNFYRVGLTISGAGKRTDQNVGYNFLVNFPPYNGTCVLTPTEGLAVLHKFQVRCTGWVDEGYKPHRAGDDVGDFLTYQFILRTRNTSSVLYSGGSPVTPWQELNAGHKDDGYRVTVIARIFDGHKGVTEMSITGRVIPPLRDSQTQPSEAQLDHILGLFQGKLSVSAAGTDIHQMARTAEAAADVLNNLVSPDINPSVESQLFWLEERSVEIPLTNGSVPSWRSLWTSLTGSERHGHQLKVTEAIQGYIQKLASVTNTTEAFSLDTVYMTSTSVESLVNPGITHEQGLEAAIDIMEIVGKSLASSIDTEMSDLQVTEALGGVVNAVGKITSVMLSESPSDETDATKEAVSRDMELQKSYLEKDELANDEKLDEIVDLHEDERLFLTTVARRRRFYKYNRQKYMLKSKLPSLLKTVDNVLEETSKFLVEGQRSVVFDSFHLTVSVERNLPKRLTAKAKHTADVKVQMGTLDSGNIDPLEEVTLKTSVHRRNPFVYDNNGTNSRVTSPTLSLQMTTEDAAEGQLNQNLSSTMTFTVDVINPAPVTMTTVTPQYIVKDRDQMLYHRLELNSRDDDIVVYLRPSVPGLRYQVYFRSGDFPTSVDNDFHTSVDFGDDGNTTMKSVRCSSGVLPSNGTIYMALKPTVFETEVMHEKEASVHIGRSNGYNVSYLMYASYDVGVSTVGCRAWDNAKGSWSQNICHVVDTSSHTQTRCRCKQPSFAALTVGTTFHVPLSTRDFSTVFTEIDLVNNSVVWGFLIGLLLLYLVGLLWGRRRDKQEDFKVWITPLQDNHPKDKYLYIVTVYTSSRLGAGTESRVGFALTGDYEDTGSRVLSDGIRKGFSRDSTVRYIMAVPHYLGHLQYLKIWHDNSGEGPWSSWCLQKVVVEDIQLNQRFVFPCGRWLAVDEDCGQIQRILFPLYADSSRNFWNTFKDTTRKSFLLYHLWFSMLLRSQKSHFSRVQSLSLGLCFVCLIMINSALFFHSEENIVRPTAIKVGFIRISLFVLRVSTTGTLLVTPVHFGIVWLFAKSKPAQNLSQDGTSSVSMRVSSGMGKSDLRDRNRQGVEDVYDTDSNSLPRGCVYIVWIILALTIGASTACLVLLSQGWGEAKSEEWMTSVLLSCSESILVVEPLKVLLLGLTSMFCKSSDKGEGNSSSELRWKCSIAVNAGRAMGGPQVVTVPMLTKDEVNAARVQMKKERLAVEHLTETLLYLIMLLLLYLIGYSNRDTGSFNLKTNIYNMLVHKQRGRPGLSGVTSTPEVFQWLNLTVLPGLFHEQYLNGSRRSWKDRYFTRDLQNVRVGPPRLRQVRQRQWTNCLLTTMALSMCHTENYTRDWESRKFCVDWTNPPCPEEEKVNKFTSEAWGFTPATDRLDMPVFGRYSSYTAGGYTAHLDVNFDVSLAVLSELHSAGWVDRQTRLLALEFTVYNANSDAFCYVNLMVEFPETGGTVTQASAKPVRLYRQTGGWGPCLLVTQITFILLYFVVVIYVVFKLYKLGLGYLADRWHILDLMSIVASTGGIAVYVAREVIAQRTLHRLRQEPRQFTNFSTLVFLDELKIDTVGLMSFIVTLRALNMLGYSHRLKFMTNTLVNVSKYMFVLCVTFSISTIPFIISGHMLFGTAINGYRDILSSASTLLNIILGNTLFGEMTRTQPFLAHIYFILLVFFVVLSMLYTFVTILNGGFGFLFPYSRKDQAHSEMVLLALWKLWVSVCRTLPKDICKNICSNDYRNV